MTAFAKKTLNLGESIASHRQALGWTQERLAEYLGVTKASVSKWETGQTRPDIFLLPDLAILFNTTIDELLDCRSQLPKQEIARLYRHLINIREREGLGPALEKLLYYRRRYGNCPEFLNSIGAWLVFAIGLARDAEQKTECSQLALELVADVRRLSQDSAQLDFANTIEATIHILTGEYGKIIAKGDQLLTADRFYLEGLFLDALHASEEYEQLSQACQALLFLHLRAVFHLAAVYMMHPQLEPERLKSLFEVGEAAIRALDLGTLPFTDAFGFYAQAAMCYSKLGENQKALQAVKTYVELLEKLPSPLEIKGNEFFDRITTWIDDLPVVMGMPPVSTEAHLNHLVDLLLLNANLEKVRQEPEFQEIAAQLKRIKEW